MQKTVDVNLLEKSGKNSSSVAINPVLVRNLGVEPLQLRELKLNSKRTE